MRILGHPVHVMLIHFPVALWPAHFALHVLAMRLPADVSAIGGFWLLVAGTVLGWLAAGAGALDLVSLSRAGGSPRFNAGLAHGLVNGTVLIGFTVLAVLEYAEYPAIRHGAVFLATEAALLIAMFAGNYFGAVARGDVPTVEPQPALSADRQGAIASRFDEFPGIARQGGAAGTRPAVPK